MCSDLNIEFSEIPTASSLDIFTYEAKGDVKRSIRLKKIKMH